MADAEELLVKCSELVLVMSELEKEVPKLKKFFSECKKLHSELCKKLTEDESILDQRFFECQKNLDKQMKKISDAIKKYEKTYDSIVGNEDVLEMIRKNAEMQVQLQEKIEQLNERIVMMEYAMQSPDSLRNVLRKAGCKFPIRVHKEGVNAWSANYYFEVERIDMGYAYGNTYIGNQISKRSHRRNLDETPFVIYESKKTQEVINQNDGFVNIPDGIDDELPFN